MAASFAPLPIAHHAAGPQLVDERRLLARLGPGFEPLRADAQRGGDGVQPPRVSAAEQVGLQIGAQSRHARGYAPAQGAVAQATVPFMSSTRCARRSVRQPVYVDY